MTSIDKSVFVRAANICMDGRADEYVDGLIDGKTLIIRNAGPDIASFEKSMETIAKEYPNIKKFVIVTHNEICGGASTGWEVLKNGLLVPKEVEAIYKNNLPGALSYTGFIAKNGIKTREDFEAMNMQLQRDVLKYVLAKYGRVVANGDIEVRYLKIKPKEHHEKTTLAISLPTTEKYSVLQEEFKKEDLMHAYQLHAFHPEELRRHIVLAAERGILDKKGENRIVYVPGRVENAEFEKFVSGLRTMFAEAGRKDITVATAERTRSTNRSCC